MHSCSLKRFRKPFRKKFEKKDLVATLTIFYLLAYFNCNKVSNVTPWYIPPYMQILTSLCLLLVLHFNLTLLPGIWGSFPPGINYLPVCPVFTIYIPLVQYLSTLAWPNTVGTTQLRIEKLEKQNLQIRSTEAAHKLPDKS